MDSNMAIGSGNSQGLKETPIDDVGDVSRGPPEYTFASLPYLQDVKQNRTGWVTDVGFRMLPKWRDPMETSYEIQHL